MSEEIEKESFNCYCYNSIFAERVVKLDVVEAKIKELEARIKELEEGISLHKTNMILQKGKVFHVDSTLWELLEGGE